MSIYGGNAFYVGILFIPRVFGIRYSLPKFLDFAEISSFPLAFDPGKGKKKKNQYVGACSSSEAWQGSRSIVRSSCLHASAFMEVIIKGIFFSPKLQFFLNYAIPVCKWKMGGCIGSPFWWGNVAACQDRNSLLWLEAWSSVRHLLVKYQGKGMSSDVMSMS